MDKDKEIEELKAKLETANALVTCCCGSPVDSHGMGDGHSPVDMYHYRLMQIEKQNEIMAHALRWYANPEIYRESPHGLAFSSSDLSWNARDTLEKAGIIDL